MLEITVFCSGALVMILEMVGGRLLAPHVGTSAIVWTSIIGIVLAFLALGAWAGGRYADKNLSARGLALTLCFAGLGSACTALFHTFIGENATILFGNIYEAAVAGAVGIFALPAFFFGMITPYIIRLRLAGIKTAGATVGRLYALSTAGSILGTFLGGFILISWFSSTSIIWGITVLALMLSLCNYTKDYGPRSVALFLALGVASYNIYQSEHNTNFRNRIVESPYNVIRIMEGNDYRHGGQPVRLMATDPGYTQSGVLINDPKKLYFEYTRFYALGAAHQPKARKILMLGGGGYSVPKWLLAGESALENPKDIELTVVEIDPAMTSAARELFFLENDDRMRIIHEDGRIFLNRQKGKFDLIFVDAFNSHYSIPFHLGTSQAIEKLYSLLTPDGIVLMNVISAITGKEGRLFRSIYAAMEKYFPEIKIYAVSHPGRPNEVQNIMIEAFKSRSIKPKIIPASSAMDPDFEEISKMSAHLYEGGITRDVPHLDDDFAPVDRYALMLTAQ